MINLPEKEELRLQGRNAIRARILGRRSCLDQIERAFHGWRSLVGYSPWGRKELDTTERLHLPSESKEYACKAKDPGSIP